MIIGAFSTSFVLFYLCYLIFWSGIIAEVISWFGRHTIFILGFDYLSGTIARMVLERFNYDCWASIFVLKIIILSVGCLIWTVVVKKVKIEVIRKSLLF